jgi:hypothetical protein
VVNLKTESITSDVTVIHHGVVINDVEELAIPDTSSKNSLGQTTSGLELLDIDPFTRKAILRHEPLKSTVNIRSSNETKTWISLPVEAGRIVTIPESYFHLKEDFVTEYPLLFDFLDVDSSLESITTTELYRESDSEGLIELRNVPTLDLSVVNNLENFVQRDLDNARWTYSAPLSQTSEVSGFPLAGTIGDNVYYGPAGTTPIERTAALEALLRVKLDAISGDTNIWLDRFFNKYGGKVIQSNYLYEPVKVTVDGVPAINITAYDGGLSRWFSPSIPEHLQFLQQGSYLKFGGPISEREVKVEYRYKSSTLRYKAHLQFVGKSSFWETPELKHAVLGAINHASK